MHVFHGKCRDFNPATDTASIELVHHGAIAVWLDNVAIDPAVSRAFLVHGADITLACHDPNRIDEAILTGIAARPSQAGSQNSSGSLKTLTGRGSIATANSGTGSASITFSPHFTAVPTLTALIDNQYSLVIGGLTISGATITVQNGPPNAYVYFSWEAQGN